MSTKKKRQQRKEHTSLTIYTDYARETFTLKVKCRTLQFTKSTEEENEEEIKCSGKKYLKCEYTAVAFNQGICCCFFSFLSLALLFSPLCLYSLLHTERDISNCSLTFEARRMTAANKLEIYVSLFIEFVGFGSGSGSGCACAMYKMK